MRVRMTSRWPIAVVAIYCLSGYASPSAANFDLLIEGGRIIDGTGNPWYAADVGIIGDTIVEIGDLSDRRAARTIDARGKVVSPGFIDMHTHVDRGFDQPDTAAILNYLHQGVTTVRPGSDGGASHRVSETKARWEANGMGLNAVHIVGFNTVRREVMGYDFLRAASADEIEQIQSLVRQAMREGSWGISAGLEYEGLHLHASTEELIEATKPVGEFEGVYISHMRDEGIRLLDSIREIVHISEGAGVPVNVTHMKAAGRLQWGLMTEAVELIQAARDRGVSITADQYPWDQSAPFGYITALVDVPNDMEELAELRDRSRDRGLSHEERISARSRYVAALQEALRDDSQRQLMRASTYEERDADWSAVAKWGWQDFRIKHTSRHPALLDKNLLDLEREQGRDGFDIVVDLVLDEPDMLFAGGSMSPDDLRHAMAQPWVMISSDGAGPFAPASYPVPSHPRSFASQAVALRQYVRDEGVLTLVDAIRKMTSLPAQFLGMRDRGLIAEGFKADLAIFDPGRVEDRATWADAHRYATGIDYVIVNGGVSIDAGEYNGARHGRLLLKR